MPEQLRDRLFEALDAIRLIDSHTHIDARSPASKTLADLLGYHYFTELAHSAGLERERIEDVRLGPKEKVGLLVGWLDRLDNTVQFSWLLEIAQSLLGLKDDRIGPHNWEALYDQATVRMAEPGWTDHVLEKSKLDAVFLTNDFDDPLTGFDTRLYIPCLRTDDLVFHLERAAVRDRLDRASGVSVGDAPSLRRAIGRLFEHFMAHGAKACAVSLPPEFAPRPIDARATDDALRKVFGDVESPGEARELVAHFVFWTLCEFCAEFRLPFDLMIGVNRGTYRGGVYQGQDLFDPRVSLTQYAEMLNAFPQVTFPISVLASVTNQELTSFAWIFPNVVTHGHWWYSNTPTFIEHDAAARLEAVPRTKQVAYYSDMYKLEFALPKFAMYKRLLAKILAEKFVIDRRWSEDRAVALGRQVLRGNVERVFGV